MVRQRHCTCGAWRLLMCAEDTGHMSSLTCVDLRWGSRSYVRPDLYWFALRIRVIHEAWSLLILICAEDTGHTWGLTSVDLRWGYGSYVSPDLCWSALRIQVTCEAWPLLIWAEDTGHTWSLISVVLHWGYSYVSSFLSTIHKEIAAGMRHMKGFVHIWSYVEPVLRFLRETAHWMPREPGGKGEAEMGEKWQKPKER